MRVNYQELELDMNLEEKKLSQRLCSTSHAALVVLDSKHANALARHL